MDDTQTTAPAPAEEQPPAENATAVTAADEHPASATGAGEQMAATGAMGAEDAAAQPPPDASQPPSDTAQAPPEAQAAEDEGQTGAAGEQRSPGFAERGRMRRRMRFLRKARELAYRDLGGLVFDLHRFGRRNDQLVLAKLDTIGRIDGELRTLEAALAERRAVTVLREAGVAACPRCAAIHGSDDRFCPNCGLAMDLRAERPMAGAATSLAAQPAPAPAPATGASGPATPTFAPLGAGHPPAADQAPAPAPAPVAPIATSRPAGPAPQAADEPGTQDHAEPEAEEPTEIIRPPAQSP